MRTLNRLSHLKAARLKIPGTYEDGGGLRLVVVRTPTQFGGHRHWFECPACSRRCRLIYGGSHFRCRQCYGARYSSQYESLPLRILRRRWRIRRKLERLAGKPWSGSSEPTQGGRGLWANAAAVP